MRRVIVDMQNFLFADAIRKTLQEGGEDFTVTISESPDKTLDLCESLEPQILIMEVTGYPPWRLEERKHITDKVKERLPACKVVLVVDENTEREVAKQVKDAKKNGWVDAFIYGSISATYLADLIDSL